MLDTLPTGECGARQGEWVIGGHGYRRAAGVSEDAGVLAFKRDMRE